MGRFFSWQLFTIFAISLSQVACSSFYYFPDSIEHSNPESFGYTKKDYYFYSEDQTKLFSWFFPASNGPSKGTIVQFHGNAQNISSHYASLVWLTKHGYNLFVFDYRGYGISEQKRASPKALYLDGKAALEFAWNLHQEAGGGKFIVFAQSIGGVVAMRSFVDFSQQQQTDLFVMDSSFISFKKIVQEKMNAMLLTWPFQWFGRWLASDEYAPISVIDKMYAPLLVIHDELDPIVTIQHADDLMKSYPAKKEIWRLREGGHMGVFLEDKSGYRQRFLERLEKIPSKKL